MNGLTEDGKMGAIRFTVLKDIPNLFVDIFSQLKESKFVLIDYTVNFCHIEKYRRRNVFVRHWMDVILNSADFKMYCPFKKGVYTLKERVQSEAQVANFIPSFFRFNDSLFIKLTGTSKKQNKIFDLFKFIELWNFGFG